MAVQELFRHIWTAPELNLETHTHSVPWWTKLRTDHSCEAISIKSPETPTAAFCGQHNLPCVHRYAWLTRGKFSFGCRVSVIGLKLSNYNFYFVLFWVENYTAWKWQYRKKSNKGWQELFQLELNYQGYSTVHLDRYLFGMPESPQVSVLLARHENVVFSFVQCVLRIS